MLVVDIVLPCMQGVFVDEQGMVAEGPNMNLGIITHDNEVVVSHKLCMIAMQKVKGHARCMLNCLHAAMLMLNCKDLRGTCLGTKLAAFNSFPFSSASYLAYVCVMCRFLHLTLLCQASQS